MHHFRLGQAREAEGRKSPVLNAVHICLLLATAVLSASAQLCFKQGSGGGKARGLWGFLVQPWLWLGIILMVLNVLVFTWVLRQVPLTAAIPFVAIVYVLVPLGARYFFSELLLPRFWIGVLLIGGGVLLTAL